MVDFTSFMTTQILQWIVNPLIWLIIIGVMVLGSFGALYIRKKRKLSFSTIEMLDFGEGKFGFNLIKSGWFGKKTFLFNLIDWGEKILKTQDNQEIKDFSTEDYQEVNGKRGVVCYRNPYRQDFLVPINRLSIKNKELVAQIAPADFTNAAVDIIKDATKETKDWKDQLLAWIAIGGVIIFALVAIIVITQMVKNGQSEASELIVKAGSICTDNCKTICSEIAQTAINSNAP